VHTRNDLLLPNKVSSTHRSIYCTHIVAQPRQNTQGTFSIGYMHAYTRATCHARCFDCVNIHWTQLIIINCWYNATFNRDVICMSHDVTMTPSVVTLLLTLLCACITLTSAGRCCYSASQQLR